MDNAILSDVKNNLAVVNEEISIARQENFINGEPLTDFLFTRFIDRLDPIEYCQNILRNHLPESKKYLHSNQVELVRAACNPKIRQVAALMARQAGKCFGRGTRVIMADRTTTEVQDIRPGDKILAANGRISTVGGVTHGRSELFWIKPTTLGDDHDGFVVNDAHILVLLDVTVNVITTIPMSTYVKLSAERQGELLMIIDDPDVSSSTKLESDFGDNVSLTNSYEFTHHSLGDGEYFGFSIVDGANDRLFLLADYTVVHNTESISSICGYLLDNYPQMRVGIFTPRVQQAEIDVGRLSTFFQMNEELLNNKIVKLNKARIEMSNGSYVAAVSASDQSNIEGLTFDIIILDEAQKVSNYTWSERIAPMGGATNAKIIKVGTPKTRNHFYECIDGKASENWKVIKRDWTQCEQLWALDSIMLPDLKTGEVRPYSRFVLEKQMPKALKQEFFPNNPEVWTEGGMDIEDFKTQYMLEFIDGAGKYLSSAQVTMLSDGDFAWLEHGVVGEHYVAGIDFAGSNPSGDCTHITVLRVTPDGVKHKVYAREFLDTSYPEQMYEIAKLFGGYAPMFEVSKIFADYTGCGAAVVQTLQQEFGLNQLEGIIFNASDRFTNSGMNMKNIMYAKFRQELDSGRFKYMKSENFIAANTVSSGLGNIGFYHKMIGEWADLESTTQHTVNKKIEAPAGYHDDACDADVLANFTTIAGQRRTMPRPVRASTMRRW